MHQLYALFENASGYALFRTTEFEEVALFLPQVRKSILDVSKFRSIVFLIAFQPFKNGAEALENMKCISEGRLHMDLQLFIENNVPKSKKSRQTVVLGVQDSELATSISETLGITCSSSGAVPEVIRGIRFHFHKLVKGYKDLSTIIKSQQGLGHHFSRAKINLNIHKFDGMITQSISLLDQMSKDINTLALRVRQWYSFHFPELSKIVPDMELYIKCVKELKDRQNMSENIETMLNSVLQDSEKVQCILEAVRSSMGMPIAEEDLENIQRFVERISTMIKRRDEATEYLKSKMHQVAPNLAAVIGELIGARLISQAGSLTSLAKYPASTVQILGAEKSLFRTMKTKGKKVPKFGSINKSTLSGKATKGKMSRYLANKCSLASRIDCFSVIPTDLHGQNLKKLVDAQAKFYETGKFGASLNLEERKENLAVKRALLRKKKKAKKVMKLLSANKLDSIQSVKSSTVDTESSNSTDSDEAKANQKGKEINSKKPPVVENMEVDEVQGAKQNGIRKQPKSRIKRKSIARKT